MASSKFLKKTYIKVHIHDNLPKDSNRKYTRHKLAKLIGLSNVYYTVIETNLFARVMVPQGYFKTLISEL